MREKVLFVIGIILCTFIIIFGVKDVKNTRQIDEQEYFGEQGYWKNALKVYGKPVDIVREKSTKVVGMFEKIVLTDKRVDAVENMDVMVGKIIAKFVEDSSTVEELALIVSNVIFAVLGLVVWALFMLFLYFFRKVLGLLLLGVTVCLANVPWKNYPGQTYPCCILSLCGGMAAGGIGYLFQQMKVHTLCKGEQRAMVVFLIICLIFFVLSLKSGASLKAAIFRGITAQILVGIYLQIVNLIVGMVFYLVVCERQWLSTLVLVYIVISAGDLSLIASVFEGVGRDAVKVVRDIELAEMGRADIKDKEIIRGSNYEGQKKAALDRMTEREIYRSLYYGDDNDD